MNMASSVLNRPRKQVRLNYKLLIQFYHKSIKDQAINLKSFYPPLQTMKTSLAFASFIAFSCSLANAAPPSNYLNWKTFKANGVNVGGWLHQEAVIDPTWWNQYAPGTPDEWDFCAKLKSKCGPILEQRYGSYITTKDIDTMAAAGINVIRVPTGYNAWVTVPGSQLYSGNQARFLRTISDYAIKKHGIHVILDIHSLPGGLNGMGRSTLPSSSSRDLMFPKVLPWPQSTNRLTIEILQSLERQKH
ncbi:hypothetical protein HZ326_16515 [Fusarium oxysporum f. sp. albedinis]|nr:hypothetical protein HZ326_16515 [Fusarium oxysporum f. sp. albedinis]